MGLKNSKKTVQSQHVLTPEDNTFLHECYHCLQNELDELNEHNFSELLKRYLDDELASNTTNLLFSDNSTLKFEKFCDFYIATVLRFHFEESNFISNIIHEGSKNVYKTFLESVIKSYWKISEHKKCKRLKSWTKNAHCEHSIEKVEQIVDSILNTFDPESNKWLTNNEIFNEVFKFVFANLFRMLGDSTLKFPNKNLSKSLLPYNMDYDKNVNVLLDLNEILFLNVYLPQDFQTEWHLLYCSQIHGESFSSLLNHIQKKGPTLLVIQELHGYKFGAFVSDCWTLGPKFYGSDRCFLFQLDPFVAIYFPSSYNQNFMYLNMNQKTLPNCLAIGGQFEYFGLCLSSEFGEGHTSETCTTFSNYKQLSKKKAFTFSHLSVWRLGPEIEDEDYESITKRSVLDGHIEDQYVLKIADKDCHSLN